MPPSKNVVMAFNPENLSGPRPDFFPPALMMLSMTYMYNGRKEWGLELTRRCMENLVCQQGVTWDQPNIVRGDTGNRAFGADYYQNMMLWSLPAAMEKKSIDGPCRAGELVDRVIRAATPRGAGVAPAPE